MWKKNRMADLVIVLQPRLNFRNCGSAPTQVKIVEGFISVSLTFSSWGSIRSRFTRIPFWNLNSPRLKWIRSTFDETPDRSLRRGKFSNNAFAVSERLIQTRQITVKCSVTSPQAGASNSSVKSTNWTSTIRTELMYQGAGFVRLNSKFRWMNAPQWLFANLATKVIYPNGSECGCGQKSEVPDRRNYFIGDEIFSEPAKPRLMSQ